MKKNFGRKFSNYWHPKSSENHHIELVEGPGGVLFFRIDHSVFLKIADFSNSIYFLGSLTSQSVYGRLLQVYSETRHYQEYPWKLSKKLSRPTSQFMMLTLSNLFDRPANYFTNLTVLKLSGECINTRLNVIGGRGGHAVTHLMASLAHSCPVLEIIDFSDVTSLYPEAIVYLCYQDAYQVNSSSFQKFREIDLLFQCEIIMLTL